MALQLHTVHTRYTLAKKVAEGRVETAPLSVRNRANAHSLHAFLVPAALTAPSVVLGVAHLVGARWGRDSCYYVDGDGDGDDADTEGGDVVAQEAVVVAVAAAHVKSSGRANFVRNRYYSFVCGGG